MAELKTKKTDQPVEAFLENIADERMRADCFAVLELMKEATGEKPVMWGDGIVGFGSYRYKYGSGHEGEWFLTGFSPRKQNLTLYVMSGFAEYAELLKQLGPYKTGKSCLYIKRLEDVDAVILLKLIREAMQVMRDNYIRKD